MTLQYKTLTACMVGPEFSHWITELNLDVEISASQKLHKSSLPNDSGLGKLGIGPGYNRSNPSWWRHQMETFSALLALCAGNSPVPVNSPHKGQWRGALMFSLIRAWINDWVNNREAGDLRRQRGHYEVNVMMLFMFTSCKIHDEW